MALSIKKSLNLFKVTGKLNTSTARNFKTHFVIALNSLDELIIDLNGVTEIDHDGMEVIRLIYDYSQDWNKPFSIVGKNHSDFICSNVA